jgi:hypothetical protein
MSQPVESRSRSLHRATARAVVVATAIVAAFQCLTAAGAENDSRPNFVLVMADDNE